MSEPSAMRRPQPESGTSLSVPAGDERLRLALAVGDLALWDWDLCAGTLRWEGHTLGFTHVAQSFASMPGSFLELVQADERAAVRAALEHAIGTGEPCDFEAHMRDAGGEVRRIAVHGVAHRNPHGQPVRFLAVARDVSARQRIETSLRESEERFRRLAEQSPDILFRVRDNRLEYISPACRTIVGFDPEVLYSQEPLWAHIHPEDQLRIPDILASLQRGAVRCEMRIRHADGHILWTEHNINPIRNPAGEVIAFEGIIRDITDRKRAEDVLRREARILEAVHDAVISTNMDGMVTTWNPAAERLFGYSAAEAIGRRVEFLWFPEDLRLYQPALIEPTIQNGTHELVVRSRKKDGEQIFVALRLTLLRDESGRPVGITGCSNDITQRLRAEQALQHARDVLEQRVAERTAELAAVVENLRAEVVERHRAEERARTHQAALAHLLRLRTVEGMAAELAHEINQPLAAIANFANGLAARLRDGKIDTAVMMEAAEQITRQALRAGQVIQRLRHFVRKDEPTRERCALNHVVEGAVRLVEPDARRHAVALRLHLDARLPAVQIDPIQIEQVVLNLLHNSLEAMSPRQRSRREIVVQTIARDDGYVEVCVRDTGKGLPGRHMQRAFEPFFTTKKSGLGMGLSISRSIIEAHAGTLWAARNPDRGTTFAFTLPVCALTSDG